MGLCPEGVRGWGGGGVQVILLGQVNTTARHLDKLTQCGHHAAHPLFYKGTREYRIIYRGLGSSAPRPPLPLLQSASCLSF